MRSRTAPRLLVAGVSVVVGAAVLAGVSACGAASGGSADTGFISGDGTLTVVPADQRKPAPALKATTLGGQQFDLADLRGKVVVLNVWGSWCGPCRAEAPRLQRASEQLADRGVVFVGLNTRDQAAPAKAFINRFGITYANVPDPDGRLQLGFRDSLPPAAIPSTIIIDRQGRVAARIIGPLDASTTLVDLAEQVLGSSPSPSGSARALGRSGSDASQDAAA
jgi:thiol-disulfide isomerase/thioredoxin